MLYFGYGSLVNRNTREPSERYLKASLLGWERQWSHRATRPWNAPSGGSEQEQPLTCDKPGVCALTVAEAAGSVIDGVVAHIDDKHIAALDLRESGYRRVVLPARQFSFDSNIEEACQGEFSDSHISVYVSMPANNLWANQDYPILRSYIDCVLAGFRKLYGESGARRFMQTTEGWRKPIFDDRQSPLYPRSVILTAEEQKLASALLAEFTH